MTKPEIIGRLLQSGHITEEEAVVLLGGTNPSNVTVWAGEPVVVDMANTYEWDPAKDDNWSYTIPMHPCGDLLVGTYDPAEHKDAETRERIRGALGQS